MKVSMDGLFVAVRGHDQWANAFESLKYTFAALEIQEEFN
jgi:hypothetical protein